MAAKLDIAGKMFARHQLDRASFNAARHYQRSDAQARRRVEAALARRHPRAR
jgi:hypothetical protein